MILPLICLIWLVFFQSSTVTYTNNNYSYRIGYNGLVWVGLDHWSIWKYQSDDKPMKWIKYKRTKV